MMQARQTSVGTGAPPDHAAQGNTQNSGMMGADAQLIMEQMRDTSAVDRMSMMSPETESLLEAKYRSEADEMASMGFENRKACLWALDKHNGVLDKAVDEVSNMDLASTDPSTQEKTETESYSYDECDVVAHVYDISGGMAASSAVMMAGMNMEFLPHTGIVVFGKEHSFTHEVTTTEIGRSLPSPVKKVVKLGRTTKTKLELDAFLESLKPSWTTQSYFFLTNNSNHYADAVAKFLLDGVGLPTDLVSLQEQLNSNPQGRQLAQMMNMMESSMRPMRQGGSALCPTGPIFHGGTPAGSASQGMMQSMMGAMGGQAAAAKEAERAQQRVLFRAQLEQLGSMGFGDEILNLRALSQAQGNVDNAINFILAAGQY
jgi:hypothetical protein